MDGTFTGSDVIFSNDVRISNFSITWNFDYKIIKMVSSNLVIEHPQCYNLRKKGYKSTEIIKILGKLETFV